MGFTVKLLRVAFKNKLFQEYALNIYWIDIEAVTWKSVFNVWAVKIIYLLSEDTADDIYYDFVNFPIIQYVEKYQCR